MINRMDREALRARWYGALSDMKVFWRRDEVASLLTDLEWTLDELDRLDGKSVAAVAGVWPKKKGGPVKRKAMRELADATAMVGHAETI